MEKKPIILIPGIQGTKLMNINEKNFKTIWSGIKKYFSNIHKLKLQFDGKSDAGAENIVERADVEDLAYSEIVNYLKSIGYRVFIFGYDWRQSNAESAIKLAELVTKVQAKLNESSINFITHSMGALVLSAYLKTLKPAQRKKFVNKAIFTVPPFLGSIEASFNLTIGKSRFINSSDDFRKIGRTFPGLYELLPVYPNAYTFQTAASARKFNPFVFSSYWQQVKNVDRPDTKVKHRLISKRLRDTGKVRDQNNLVFDLSKMDAAERKNYLVLVGGGEITKQKIFVQENKDDLRFYFDYRKFNDTKQGDGTVSIQSSGIFRNQITTLQLFTTPLEKRADSRFIMADWHAFYLNNGRVQNILKRFIDPKNHKTLSPNWYESRGGDIEKL